VVKAAPQPVGIVAGGSAQSTIRLTIQSGYHINANPPTYSYLKATELDIPSSEGVSVAFISYPDPITRQLAFADKPIAVYEGETPLKVMLKADKAAKKGERSLSGKLRVQACDDQVCYPPGALDVSIPVTIK
jgi:DsbC/DsbD-like thiol-disulfide interchange protein